MRRFAHICGAFLVLLCLTYISDAFTPLMSGMTRSCSLRKLDFWRISESTFHSHLRKGLSVGNRWIYGRQSSALSSDFAEERDGDVKEGEQKKSEEKDEPDISSEDKGGDDGLGGNEGNEENDGGGDEKETSGKQEMTEEQLAIKEAEEKLRKELTVSAFCPRLSDYHT